MKRYIAIALVLLCAMLVLGCGSEEAAAGGEAAGSESGILVENAFKYTHVDGHGGEADYTAFVLFEYEQLRTIKYQVAYIACTCRGPEVNYWSVAFVEINKADNTIASMSFEEDDTDHYVAGLYGDSFVSWDGVPVRELFDGFIVDEIIGASEEQIDAYQIMSGDADAYTGATVTPNNAMTMLQGLFEYHNANYGDA